MSVSTRIVRPGTRKFLANFVNGQEKMFRLKGKGGFRRVEDALDDMVSSNGNGNVCGLGMFLLLLEQCNPYSPLLENASRRKQQVRYYCSIHIPAFRSAQYRSIS